MSSQMVNICDKFHWNPSTKYRDTASHKMVLTDNGRTARWHTRKQIASTVDSSMAGTKKWSNLKLR